MSLVITMAVNANPPTMLAVAKRLDNTHTNILDPDVTSTYEVVLVMDGEVLTTTEVQHRYGDGMLALSAKALSALQEKADHEAAKSQEQQE